MTGSPYRAAIIGTGRIASSLERDPLRVKPQTHAGWYAWCPRTELVAGCDLDEERLRLFGEQWGMPEGARFRDYREMLDRVRPDIVSVCGYAPDRFAMIEAAVESGARGLWIEKAIACSLDEADAIARLVEDRGVAAVVDQPRRGNPAYLGVQDAITASALGRLQAVHCLMSGQLIHTGVHAWDVLRMWCGEWASVAAWLDDESPSVAGPATAGRQPPTGPRVEDRGGHAHIAFENGTHAFVSGGLKGYFIFQFDVVFEGGRIRLGNDVDELDAPSPSPRYSNFLELEARGPVPRSARTPAPMLLDLVDAIAHGQEPVHSVRHAIESFRLGVGIFQSHLEGHRRMARSEVRPDLYVSSV